VFVKEDQFFSSTAVTTEVNDVWHVLKQSLKEIVRPGGKPRHKL